MGLRLGAHLLVVGLIVQHFWGHVEVAACPASKVKHSLLANRRPDKHSTVSRPSPLLCCTATLSRQAHYVSTRGCLAVEHMDHEHGTHICSTACRVQQRFCSAQQAAVHIIDSVIRHF